MVVSHHHGGLARLVAFLESPRSPPGLHAVWVGVVRGCLPAKSASPSLGGLLPPWQGVRNGSPIGSGDLAHALRTIADLTFRKGRRRSMVEGISRRGINRRGFLTVG